MATNALQYAMPPEAQMKPAPGNFTAPAPAPAAPRANALTPTPMMTVQPKAPQPNALGQAFQSFARGFAPEQVKTVDDRAKADAAEKAKRALVWMKQTAAQPAERRAQFTLASAQDIARDTGQPYEAVVASAQDPNEFSDEKLAEAISRFSALAGEAPAAPEYQFLQGPDGAISLGNKGTGVVQQVQPGTPKPKNPIIIGNNAYDPDTYEPIIQGEDKPPWVGAVKGPDGQWMMDPNYVKGYRQLHPDTGGGAGHKLRPATPEEASKYGPAGTMGQIDDVTGRFYPTSRPNPQTGGMPTENERKFALYAQSAKTALKDIDRIEFGKDYADGVTPTWERGNQINPFDEKARSYDQAIDRFLDGWARAMTGAAMTKEEKEFYYGIMKPTFGDSEAVRVQKAQSRHNMARDLETAAARGMNAYNERDAAQPDDGEAFIDSLFPPDGADGEAPDGVTPEEWQHMTPEERALFQ